MEGSERSHRVRRMKMLDRITSDPNICLGQPTIRGKRITVSFILKLLASDLSVQEIVESYPELELEDIQQALNYASWAVSSEEFVTPRSA